MPIANWASRESGAGMGFFPPPVVPLVGGRKAVRKILPDEKLNLWLGERVNTEPLVNWVMSTILQTTLHLPKRGI